MANLSKMAASVFSATNENTLALGSLKLDFSLIKYEAPVEFSGLGAALSPRRRTDAEDGLHHKTARRLAAHFEQLIPSTPKLITAYGLRSSEIIQMPGVNPQGSSKHGPFESFVGADGTAMWAAATSGVPALGVYLLACLLARAWDAKEAISIWVELVEYRRKAIEEEFKANCAISESSLNSVRQDILRDDLARWDASARAWLLSADQAKVKEQTQLMLVLKNCQLPFSAGESTYSKVIQSWKQALSSLEDLLCGKPQEISNRSILLAFSAWHLYPNLIVLGSEVRNVTFDDPLVDRQGVGTIALQPRSATAAQGTAWSLTLSHLRYYGDPVTVRSHADFSRVTIHELHIVALGSIFRLWGIGQREILPVLLLYSDWLGYLAKAANRVLLSNPSNKSADHQLFDYGRRRAKDFLGGHKEECPPFFGLGKHAILCGLAEIIDDERPIAYLRAFAMENSYRSGDAYIGHAYVGSGSNDNGWQKAHILFREYMTAIPHTCASRKRDSDRNQVTEAIHARWICPEVPQNSHGSVDSDRFVDRVLEDRVRYLMARGENGSRIRDAPYKRPPGKDWAWKNPPRLFKYQRRSQLDKVSGSYTDSYRCPSTCRAEVPCRCFDCDDHTMEQSKEDFVFSPVWHIGHYTLFVNDDSNYPSPRAVDEGAKFRGGMYLQPAVSIERICKMKADAVLGYLQHMVDQKVNVTKVNYLEKVAEQWTMSEIYSRALHALAIATRVYLQLDGATISLKVVEAPLNKAPWLVNLSTSQLTIRTLARARALACIAHFESGLLLQPDELDQTLAIASGNSIFVIEVIVSDPFEDLATDSIKRIIGNIGRTGICLMVAPFEPKIRPLGAQYNLVEHAVYDGKRENNFKGTSLHLSFTEWTIPLEINDAGGRTIDQEAYLVESVISVLDSGKWVADLDILCIDFKNLTRLRPSQQCPGHPNGRADYDYTSLDSWEELLDGPMSVGFFRAHGNWAARLAAVSILSQKGQAHSIGLLGPEAFCLECLGSDHETTWVLDRYESPLPSMCID